MRGEQKSKYTLNDFSFHPFIRTDLSSELKVSGISPPRCACGIFSLFFSSRSISNAFHNLFSQEIFLISLITRCNMTLAEFVETGH